MRSRTTMKHLARVSIAAIVASLFVATGSTAVRADDEEITAQAILCDNKGETWYTVENVIKPKKLTHKERYYNGSGEDMDAEFKASWQKTLTASVTVTTGGSAEAGKIFAKFEARFDVALAAAGSKTWGSDVSVKAKLAPRKYLVAYRGNVEVSGGYTKLNCNSSGRLVTKSEGKAKSFTDVAETGTQRCDLVPPTGSMAALAKESAC